MKLYTRCVCVCMSCPKERLCCRSIVTWYGAVQGWSLRIGWSSTKVMWDYQAYLKRCLRRSVWQKRGFGVRCWGNFDIPYWESLFIITMYDDIQQRLSRAYFFVSNKWYTWYGRVLFPRGHGGWLMNNGDLSRLNMKDAPKWLWKPVFWCWGNKWFDLWISTQILRHLGS